MYLMLIFACMLIAGLLLIMIDRIHGDRFIETWKSVAGIILTFLGASFTLSCIIVMILVNSAGFNEYQLERAKAQRTELVCQMRNGTYAAEDVAAFNQKVVRGRIQRASPWTNWLEFYFWYYVNPIDMEKEEAP